MPNNSLNMLSITNIFERIFGRSQNAPLAELLSKQAGTAARCAAHTHKTKGADLQHITELEHEGDQLEAEIHEILDNSFILRFDKSDVTHLTAEIDDMLDGMRRVAKHMHVYGALLQTLKPEALELLKIIESMARTVEDLSNTLREKRLPHKRIQASVKALATAETAADRLLEKAEAALIAEFTVPGKSAIEFAAWNKLFRLLERITDSADHCGRHILSISRKEA